MRHYIDPPDKIRCSIETGKLKCKQKNVSFPSWQNEVFILRNNNYIAPVGKRGVLTDKMCCPGKIKNIRFSAS